MGSRSRWDSYGKCGVKEKPWRIITVAEAKKIKVSKRGPKIKKNCEWNKWAFLRDNDKRKKIKN